MIEYRLISEPPADRDVEAAFEWYENERPGLGATLSIGVFQRDSLPPLTAPIASGWNDQLPGGTHTHWRSPSFHGTPDSPHKRGN